MENTTETVILHQIIRKVQVTNSTETCRLLIVPSVSLSTLQQRQIAYTAVSCRGCLLSWQQCSN